MSNPILVLNSGSSSIKYSLFLPDENIPIVFGLAERLGESEAQLSITQGNSSESIHIPHADHRMALEKLALLFGDIGIQPEKLAAIGHRVVHGGEYFSESIIVDDDAIKKMESCNHLAPLHNPANLLGISTMKLLAPNVPQIAVFDTAFHQTLPPKAYLYALPYEYYENFGVRRYGFHGTSHRYVAQKAADMIGQRLDTLSLISIHLGNGCSATAIHNGKSVDTTMGMTPLEGLAMGTRCGDLDPSIHQFLTKKLNLSINRITEILNKSSGLLGISGISNDMRSLIKASEQGNERATLAIEVFCFKVSRLVGGLATSLTQIDALLFTGGIGENSAHIRHRILENLSILGFKIDTEANTAHGKQHHGLISSKGTIPTLVVPTNEEWMIAFDCIQLLKS